MLRCSIRRRSQNDRDRVVWSRTAYRQHFALATATERVEPHTITLCYQVRAELGPQF